MWSDGEPIGPSPTIDQAINAGFPWLEIRCVRCKSPSDVDLAAMKHVPTTFVHDLATRLRCRKCATAGRRPAATLLQLAAQQRDNPDLQDKLVAVGGSREPGGVAAVNSLNCLSKLSLQHHSSTCG